jgi:hypothetical protein
VHLYRARRDTIVRYRPGLQAVGRCDQIAEYVSSAREEFRRHKDAKPDFVVGFLREWEKYLQGLQLQVVTGKVSELL